MVSYGTLMPTIKLFGAGVDEIRDVPHLTPIYCLYKIEPTVLSDINAGILRHPEMPIPLITLEFKRTNFKTHIPLYICEDK